MNSSTGVNAQKSETKRNTGLDIARIIAMLAVIILHSAYNSTAKVLVSFCVLLFVMVSGALWLNEARSITSGKLIKSILRIVVAFIFWSCIYTILYPEGNGIYDFVRQLIIGPFHFWYCYMIIGLYAVLPILKSIQKDKKVFTYFFIISFITAILLPSLASIGPLSGFIEILAGTRIYIGLGYVFYFVLGHLLLKNRFSVTFKIVYCILGIGSCISMFYIDLGGDFSLLKMIYTSTVFILAMELGKLIKSEKIQAALSFLSKQCFTVYLIHILVINLLEPSVKNVINNECLYCCLIIIITFFIATILNMLWNYSQQTLKTLFKK